MSKGYFLVVEGIGGSGKSTLCDRIAQWFQDANIPHLRTFDPGCTLVGQELRAMVRKGFVGDEPITPMTTALMFNAARSQLTTNVIKPALEEGKVVICDRYFLSTYAFQGAVGGVSIFTLDQIHHNAIGLRPDATLVMCGDAEVFNKRVSDVERATDRWDAMAMSSIRRAQAFYEREAEENETYHEIDAEESAEQVFAQVIPLLMQIQNKLFARPTPVAKEINSPSDDCAEAIRCHGCGGDTCKKNA